ncbi:MAG: PaaI family thioesterase [Clostridia bacterium]|nr:PaaI family thioesterase [Clostridia bacterium]
MLPFEELWAYFQNDRFAVDVVGITVECVREDKVVCRLPICDCHRNADGAVMGGVSFSLGDFAFALFANRHKISTVTQSATISYLGVAKGQELVATVTPIKEGRSVVNAEVLITDELGVRVAHMVASGFRKS